MTMSGHTCSNSCSLVSTLPAACTKATRSSATLGDKGTRLPSRNSVPPGTSRQYEPNSYWLPEAIAEDPKNFIRKIAEVPKDYQAQGQYAASMGPRLIGRAACLYRVTARGGDNVG